MPGHPSDALALADLATIAAAGVAALVVRLAWGPVVAALPEPPDGPSHAKPPYVALRGPRHARIAAVLVAVAGLALLLAPPGVRPAWLGLTALGVPLALVDARTTWLPLPLTRPLWAVAALGLGVLPLTAGWAETTAALAAAVATAGFFWLFWRVTGGIGFGDVRLAPTIGAAAGAVSPAHAFAAVLLGTLLGALLGVARAGLGRRGPFAYGPALVAGPWLALVVLPLPA